MVPIKQNIARNCNSVGQREPGHRQHIAVDIACSCILLVISKWVLTLQVMLAVSGHLPLRLKFPPGRLFNDLINIVSINLCRLCPCFCVSVLYMSASEF